MVSTRQSIVVRVFVSAALVFPFFNANVGAAAEPTGAPSTVVAKQGGVSVTLEDVDTFAQTIPPDQRNGFFDSPTRLEDLIGTLLLKKQLAVEARALGLDHDPTVLAKIAEASDNALSVARMKKFKDDMKLPDFSQLAKEEFLGHKETYATPSKIDVKQVLISIKSHSKEEAQALAETVRKDALAKPGEFDALVEKFSEDPSKSKNHGLMSDAGGSQYVRAFSDAAKELKKVGDISPVVESPYGYHVLQLVSRTAPSQPAFADVKDKIIARLQADYTEKQVREHTDSIRNLPIDATPALVASLRTRYQGGEQAPVPADKGSLQPAKN